MSSPREGQRTSSGIAEKSAHLLALPELLLIILGYFTDDADIISLACVCRRLNDVSLSYHLDSDLEERFLIFGSCFLPYTFFRKLRLCFFKPAFSFIDCHFSDNAAEEIREVLRYLDSIEIDPPEVSVDLSDVCPHTVKSMPPAELEAFFRDLQQLNCRDLTPFVDLQQEPEVESVPFVGFHPPPLTSLGTVTLYPQPKHLADWLVRSINQSSVRMMTVCDAASTLTKLTLPRLRELIFQRGRISTDDLYLFLLRHTSIKHITIHASVELLPLTEQIHIQSLPKLSQICAPPEVLTLLSPQLLSAVRDIRLEAYLMSMDAEQFVHNHQEALLFVSQLPNAYSLTIWLGHLISTGTVWADFVFPDSYGLQRAEQRLVNITTLCIADLISIPAFQLAEAVARFPNVQDLHFWNEPEYSLLCAEKIMTACPSLITISTAEKEYNRVSLSGR
ncbi:uncharacterized protein BT62DRAFT_995964 [Guyanagaster necrorhizus]|uniref:F-box domain-containing protein n=1 Tax=Guyanagaster necrorhizus TaxID=856835 RepID=A0A9P7VP11_9AGAR|nr:uncharacterized protein BT62DRAFT_995964 [Guyanagaster necrorhizus MCA 3950]KAG7443369.1 hypothetical protein BT62DRAFT_995964 [Guyanagaster necrorhizus MCA 3950]